MQNAAFICDEVWGVCGGNSQSWIADAERAVVMHNDGQHPNARMSYVVGSVELALTADLTSLLAAKHLLAFFIKSNN
jgi:hypothetical protein